MPGAPLSVATMPYLVGVRPRVFAHRGFSDEGLENSMQAFRAAVDLGCGYVETDTHVTRDGVVVAFHDDRLDRVTDASGAIADLSFDRVRRARIHGHAPIPTLEELLTELPDVKVNIDIKAPGAAEATAAVVNRCHAHDRVCIGSFEDATRRRGLAVMERAVATAAGTNTVRAFVAATRLRWQGLANRVLADIDCLQVPEVHDHTRIVSPRAVEMAHAAGTEVHVWTVNDPTDMQRLLDWGVDGLVTDRADVALGLVATHGTTYSPGRGRIAQLQHVQLP